MQNQTFKISLERPIKSKLALTAIAAVLALLDVILHTFQRHSMHTCMATAEQSCSGRGHSNTSNFGWEDAKGLNQGSLWNSTGTLLLRRGDNVSRTKCPQAV